MGILNFLAGMFQVNTDGTPMMGDSGFDIEGKVLGETNHHDDSFFSPFDSDSNFGSGSGGFGNEF